MFASMTGCLAVIVWVYGMMLVNGVIEGDDQDIFTDALRGLYTVLAVSSIAFGIWCATRSGWRIPITALIVYLMTPLPFLCLVWLSGAASIQVLGSGLLFLTLGSCFILGVGKGIVRVASSKYFESVVLGALQLVFAGGVVVSRDHWLGWIGI